MVFRGPWPSLEPYAPLSVPELAFVELLRSWAEGLGASAEPVGRVLSEGDLPSPRIDPCSAKRVGLNQ